MGTSIFQNTPPDHAARLSATNPEQSFVVSAPAGSGKTGLLTLRVLKLLSVVDKPEEILCITFTRKAAREMQERIFGALEKANELRLRLGEENATASLCNDYDRSLVEAALEALTNDQKNAWQLLQSPQRLNISTIDGFCKALCNQLPFFSRLGTNVGILEDPKMEYTAAVTSWMRDALQKKHPEMSTLLAHVHGDLEKLNDLFSQLLAVRDQWLPFVYAMAVNDGDALKQKFELTINRWVEHAISELEIYFRPYESDICELVDYASNNLDDLPEHLAVLKRYKSFVTKGSEAPGYWRAIANFCLTKASQPSFRKKLDKRDGFPTGKTKEEKATAKAKKQQLLDIFRALVESVDLDRLGAFRYLPETHYKNEQWLVLDALIKNLPQLTAYLRLRFAETSSTDFVEFSLAAVTALDPNNGDIDLLQRLDYRIKHILIDEFQDTSQVQLNLLRALTREWLPDDGKSLFLVGDGMQSCYGFRNANVGIFLNMRQQGLDNINTTALDLNVNFRSSETIVNWVNQHFQSAFPKENDPDYGSVRYIPSISFNQDQPSSYVRCVGFYQIEEDSPKNTMAIAEGNYICDEIIGLLADKPNESIAILVKSRSHIKQIIEILTKRSIDYKALELDALASEQHIKDIQNLAQILTEPTDKLSWLACLRAPICALNHEDLFQVFHCDTEEKQQALPIELIDQAMNSDVLSEKGKGRLERFINIYNGYSRFLGRRGLAEILELMWMELGGPEQLSNSADIEDIKSFLKLIEAHEHEGQLNWQSFSNNVQKLYANPASTSDNPVQIMTMHKSKGLEFDTVFLPQLHKAPRSEDPELLYWLSRGDLDSPDFVLSPMSSQIDDEQDSLSQFIKSQRLRKVRLEETRIFYVACTRAKTRLYLSAELSWDEENQKFKGPSKNSMLGKIWPTVQTSFLSQRAIPNNYFSRSVRPTSLKALPLEWRSKLFSERQKFHDTPTEYHPPRPADGKSEATTSISAKAKHDNSGLNVYEEFSSETLAIKIGKAFHKVLEILSQKGNSIGFEKTNLNAKRFSTILRSQGLNSEELDYWANKFAVIVQGLKSDSTAQWLLDPSHKQSASELMLIDTTGKTPRHHVVDRTFIDGGIRWVIDYKTSRPEDNESQGQFVARELQLYYDQMTRYMTAITNYDRSLNNKALPQGIKLALYFPFIRHLEVIDEEKLK